MNRQRRTADFVKKQMEEYPESDSDGDYPPQLSEEEYQMVDQLIEMFTITENQAIQALVNGQYNFDYAVEDIQERRAKEKREKDREAKKKEKVQEKQLEKQLEKQEKELQKNEKLKSEKSKEDQLPAELLKRTSSEGLKKTGDFGARVRKNSHVIEEYQINHYNSEYPIMEISEDSVSRNINIVVVGHVDSGKSTVVGVLLQEAAFLSKKEVHRNQKQSKEMGKESFKHAWVTDSTEEERRRGVTIDVGVKKIEVGNRRIVFLDSPGHRDFIPNMITGAAQADYAILVVDVDNFETSFVGGGQTKEHAYIVRSLGVNKIIVAVNKMDRVDWSVDKFLQVKNRLNEHLLKIGFKEEAIVYCPISAIHAINMTKKQIKALETSQLSYTTSLFDLIMGLELPIRPIGKPFRMSITNCYDSPAGKLKGHCFSGKIDGGTVHRQEKLLILPENVQCIVKEILVSNEKAKQASSGDHVELQIKIIEEFPFESIHSGSVLSSLKYCIPVANKFVMEALALDLDMPILKGTEVVVYIGTNKSPARIMKINYIFNPNNGTIIKKNPKSIRSNDCSQIEVETKEKVCIELFSNFKTFGRVIIRQKKSTLFVGTIKMIK